MIVYYMPEEFIPVLNIYEECRKEKVAAEVYSPLLEMTLIFFKNHSNQSDRIYFIKELLKIIEEYDFNNPYECFKKIDQLSPSFNLIGHENIENERIEHLLVFIVRFEIYIQKYKNVELTESVEKYLIDYIKQNYQVAEHLEEFLIVLEEYKNSKINLEEAIQKLRKFSYK